MKKPEATRPPRLPSLADYLLRYDLQTLMEEARYDYSQGSSGSPRHLNQKDISARFRRQQGGAPAAPAETPPQTPPETPLNG